MNHSFLKRWDRKKKSQIAKLCLLEVKSKEQCDFNFVVKLKTPKHFLLDTNRRGKLSVKQFSEYVKPRDRND